MIHTPRPPEPAKLKANRERWTNRWRKTGPNQDWATKAAKQVIKEALRPMAHGKCAFCEGLLEVTSHFEIEHFVAKTNRETAFEWSNLFPACGKCNREKSTLVQDVELVKPDIDDPEQFFWVNPDGALEPHPRLTGSDLDRAKDTIKAYGLQRGSLRGKRQEAWVRIGRWKLRGLDAAEGDDFLKPEAEFKLVLRQLLAIDGHHALVQEDHERFERRNG